MIDDSVISKYLNGEDISDEWIFYNLLPGEHLFETPERSNDEIRFLHHLVKEKIRDFSPYHQEFFDHVFPGWRRVYENEIKVMLVVGCPYPYEAMTRIKDDAQIMIFDVNRIDSGGGDAEAATELIRRLITHELFHILYENTKKDKAHEGCVDKGHTQQETSTYRDELLDLVFNEGFAHYLSMEDQIRDRYEDLKKEHYERNLERLKIALEARDKESQKQYLIEANTGNFYDKFASIVGMFILIDHEERIEEVYRKGSQNILSY